MQLLEACRLLTRVPKRRQLRILVMLRQKRNRNRCPRLADIVLVARAQQQRKILPSEHDHIEAGDGLKVTQVDRGHIEADMQGCSPNQQVLEGESVSLGRLLALDAPGKLGDLQSQRMHDQVVEDALHEDAPPDAVGVCSGSVDAVCQFHGADGRQRDIDLSMRLPRTAQDVFDALTAPFTCDQDAGIEDQAQDVSPMPTYRVACGCG